MVKPRDRGRWVYVEGGGGGGGGGGVMVLQQVSQSSQKGYFTVFLNLCIMLEKKKRLIMFWVILTRAV